ncbi:MAG: hypothetical protein AB8Y82_03705, partial [Coxiella endosymbiont of Haemaphysalis qinghaiensis]
RGQHSLSPTTSVFSTAQATTPGRGGGGACGAALTCPCVSTFKGKKFLPRNRTTMQTGHTWTSV